MSMRFAFLAVLLVALTAPSARAVIITADDFSTDGPLVGTTPDVDANWAVHSGGVNKPIQVSGGAARLVQSAGSGQDVNINWLSNFGNTKAGDTIYAGFDLVVNKTDANPFTNASGIARMMANGSTPSGSIVSLISHSQGDFTLALGSTTSGPADYTGWSAPLSFGETYRVVHSYEYDTGTWTLWVDPVSEASTSVSRNFLNPGQLLHQYALNQNTGGNSTQAIDNIFVATSFAEALTGTAVPEPSAAVLLLLAASISAAYSRRR